jgi:predicted dehydrogenase
MRPPLSFGMIGGSSIGGEALLEPLARRDDARAVRVAARRPGAAEAYAGRWGIPRASADYEDVVGDDEVDAVYISNAAADHARWAVAALEHGKHVLCEKPIATSAAEASDIAAAAEAAGRTVMEGFHYRFHPLFGLIRRLVASGRFGELRSIGSVIDGVRLYDPRSILHARQLGGGALLHNGVYGLHWTRLLYDAEPVEVRAEQLLNPSGADSSTSADLLFPGGRSAHLECSFDRDAPVSLTLRFDGATVTASGVIGPHHGHSLRIAPVGAPSEVRTVAGGSSFDYQLAEFISRCEAPERPSARGDDIVANMRVVDAVREAARSGVPAPERNR